MALAPCDLLIEASRPNVAHTSARGSDPQGQPVMRRLRRAEMLAELGAESLGEVGFDVAVRRGHLVHRRFEVLLLVTPNTGRRSSGSPPSAAKRSSSGCIDGSSCWLVSR